MEFELVTKEATTANGDLRLFSRYRQLSQAGATERVLIAARPVGIAAILVLRHTVSLIDASVARR
jgi:hypothetical protein